MRSRERSGQIGLRGVLSEVESFQPTKDQELAERARRAAHLIVMAAVTIYPSWTLFDFLMAPDWWKTFAALRFLQAGLILVAYAIWRAGRLQTDALVYVAFLGMALQIAFMCAVVPNAVLVPYFLGFSTLFLAAGILVLWDPVHSAIILVASVAAFLIANLWWQARAVSAEVESGGFMFVTLAIVSILLTRMRWQMVREEIDARLRIEAAHQKLERQASELATSNRELERFAGTVSHDLKTPMNRLSLAVGLLEDPELDEAGRREMVGAMRRSIDSASRTIDELLRAAKAQRGGTSGAHGCADLTEVYAELESDLAEELRKVGGRASIDFPGCPKIAMERGNLKSILMNLMTNALKFRSPERRLEIQLRTVCTPGFVVLSVADNGIGIDLDHAGENPLRERRNPNIEGSGLGLRLVEEIVEAAGGHIEVESALDRGATFRVWLPEASRESERA